MKRTKLLQEIRKMRFEEAYNGWLNKRITQEEAARLLGVCERSFRRYINRYEEDGLDGLTDKRLDQISHRCAPVDEVMGLSELYKSRYEGFNVKHFYRFYRDRHDGSRSYTWVKNQLQSAGDVAKAPRRGAHRRRRDRAPVAGMMLHQDGSTHEWVPDKTWDLIVTMDDATSEHYSMFFIEQEGTVSSFLGIKDVILTHGLFCSLYTDRGSHYWNTPEAGGKVDKKNLTQFGRAMHQLGIEMIAAYSPEARGRSERMFRTHQDRLVKELTAAGITEMPAANRYLSEVYLPAFNQEFMEPAREQGTSFVSAQLNQIQEVLCEHYQRVVSRDNCVSLDGLILQIPPDRYRCHYVKATVRVQRYLDGALAIFHGPRKLANYHPNGTLNTGGKEIAA